MIMTYSFAIVSALEEGCSQPSPSPSDFPPTAPSQRTHSRVQQQPQIKVIFKYICPGGKTPISVLSEHHANH